MGLPAFVDLRSFSQHFSADGRLGKVTRLINKAAVAQSCVADLRQANDHWRALAQLRSSKEGTLKSTLQSALLSSAVVLYGRATSTGGGRGERGPIDIRPKLQTPEQLDDHNKLIAVRNRAIAHVYSEETHGDHIWHHERFFMVDVGESWKFGAGSKRVYFHGPTADRLGRQVPVAIELVTGIFQKHIDRLSDLLNSDPVSDQALREHLTDPVEFFGSIEAVEHALAGIEQGWSAGLTQEL